MTRISSVWYRLSLLREVVAVTMIVIALRAHITTVSVDEWYRIRRRRDRIREQIAEIRGES